jgi:hypothetical protein
MKPFISFVVTARNDDYGGNWTNRISAFIKVLIYQTNRLSLPCELVFVEYNPPVDKKHIYEELSIADNKFLDVRFITVPKEFHQKLPKHEKVTVCEFIGKNIGIRRAQGEWIVATNPDVLYSSELFDFFASKKLDEKSFYRINRSDTSISKVPAELTAEKILTAARSSIIKIMYSDHSEYMSWKVWFNDLVHGRSKKIILQCPLLNSFKAKDPNKIHENAAGDFLLAHRSVWDTIGGYDERTVGSGVLDSYALYLMYCTGLTQNVLPYDLYHLYHHHKGVKYLASHAQLRKDAEEMLKTKIPYKPRKSDWGFPNESFLAAK